MTGGPDACLFYGRSLYLLDRFALAIDTLRGALKVSQTVEGHRLLALSLEALGRPAEAEPEFLAALQRGPRHRRMKIRASTTAFSSTGRDAPRRRSSRSAPHSNGTPIPLAPIWN
jgi:hypothetical protein